MARGQSKYLTAQMQAFVNEYLIDLNATAAYKRAGYAWKNENTAKANSARMMTRPLVKAAIDKAMAERAGRTHITADLVLQGLLREAQGQGEDTTPAARVAAWTQLGKHLKLFTDIVETKTPQDELWRELLHFIKARAAARLTTQHPSIEITNGHSSHS